MRIIKYFIFIAVAGLFSSCKTNNDNQWAIEAVERSGVQLAKLAKDGRDSGKLPRSITEDGGEVRLVDLYDWTSGFFPGSLWYQYELSGDVFFKEQAEYYTSLLLDLQYFKGTHDLGFMMYCSYGNQNRLVPNDSLPQILVNTAESLSSRYNDTIKAIRSWDFGVWNYPVIIDNMMNLDVLFWASDYTGNSRYRDVAVGHALTTLKHHFRDEDDFSCYHVISYNDDGTVESKGTFQGYADDSRWARGQAWAVYGMTVVYRETKDPVFLQRAQEVAKLIMEHPSIPEDKVPFWDYDAPNIPDAPRDVSAAAVTAAGLLELSTLVENGSAYFEYASDLLKNLSHAPYLAEAGDAHGFVLKHSVGHLPANSEIDTPLNYADYYYMEALKRYFDIKGISYPLNQSNK